MTVAAEAMPVNEVRLQGRLTQDPVERSLPSGDEIWVFRVVVDRPAGGTDGRARLDALDCVVWGGRARRAVRSWHAGDTVEVVGALRRRFFRTATGTASRVEVEVGRARIIRRAATA